MTDKIDVLLSEETVNSRIRELAAEIDRDYAGKELVFLITLKGATIFGCELAKRVTVPVYLEFIKAHSYQGTESSGTVQMTLDVDPAAIEGKHVLIIEDILDTGRTLTAVKKLMETRNPASLKICTLLDKPEGRVVELEADYVGFVIPDEFVVGYGLDVDQRYRTLPFVGIYRPPK